MCRSRTISFSPFQNASSRLTLVLWPATTTERLTIVDFIKIPPFVLNATAQPFRYGALSERPAFAAQRSNIREWYSPQPELLTTQHSMRNLGSNRNAASLVLPNSVARLLHTTR